MGWRFCIGLVLALEATVLVPARVAADDGSALDSPAVIPNPLARVYVDLGVHFGPAWHGTTVDSRYSAVGVGGGMTLDIGRPPFWGGVHADVGMFKHPFAFNPPAIL